MNYRKSASQGVRLRFKRRQRLPPQYGPKTLIEQIAWIGFQKAVQELMRGNELLSAITNDLPYAGGDIKIRLPNDFRGT